MRMDAGGWMRGCCHLRGNRTAPSRGSRRMRKHPREGERSEPDLSNKSNTNLVKNSAAHKLLAFRKYYFIEQVLLTGVVF